MLDIERRIFIDENKFSIGYTRYHAEIYLHFNLIDVYITWGNKCAWFNFISWEEAFRFVEGLKDYQGTEEKFEEKLFAERVS